jgi:hypothetical protein
MTQRSSPHSHPVGWHKTWLIIACVAVGAIWIVAIQRSLTREATLALETSDRAFNDGKLRDALQSAHRASMAWTPGSALTRQAIERLRAIAVGSEATGRQRSALLAWSALDASSFDAASGNGWTMMRREAAQHVQVLLPRRSDVREEAASKSRVSAVQSAIPRQGSVPAALSFLLAIALLGWAVSRDMFRDTARARLAVSVMGLVSGLFWCMGWFFV